jgi:hypothetical protein
MSTLTATYCAICDIIAKAFRSMIETFESIGRARAAAELARQGYVKEAKELMLSK